MQEMCLGVRMGGKNFGDRVEKDFFSFNSTEVVCGLLLFLENGT